MVIIYFGFKIQNEVVIIYFDSKSKMRSVGSGCMYPKDHLIQLSFWMNISESDMSYGLSYMKLCDLAYIYSYPKDKSCWYYVIWLMDMDIRNKNNTSGYTDPIINTFTKIHFLLQWKLRITTRQHCLLWCTLLLLRWQLLLSLPPPFSSSATVLKCMEWMT